jgi:hypothetical protein
MAPTEEQCVERRRSHTLRNMNPVKTRTMVSSK